MYHRNVLKKKSFRFVQQFIGFILPEYYASILNKINNKELKLQFQISKTTTFIPSECTIHNTNLPT